MRSKIPRALSSTETAALRPPMSVRTHPGMDDDREATPLAPILRAAHGTGR